MSNSSVATILDSVVGDQAGGTSTVTAYVDGDANSEQSFQRSFSNQSGDDSGIGHLLLTLNVTAGLTDSITFDAASNGFLTSASPVPVPEAIWLFGSALAGLIGILRRIK
jgi:hypothetical protein